MPQSLTALLSHSLKKARRVAVLGVGSDLRGDDAAGVLAAQRLARGRNSSRKVALGIFIGWTAPENLTGEIKRFKPTHLIIIDAIDAGQKPGTILFLEPEVVGGASFSTHTLPARILADYLTSSTRCKVLIVGIQPRNVAFGTSASKTVRGSALYVANAIRRALRAIATKEYYAL